jgi:alpha-mannosidase
MKTTLMLLVTVLLGVPPAVFAETALPASPSSVNAAAPNPATDATDVGKIGKIESGKVTDAWVVCKTHLDIGYTDTVKNILTKYRTKMMDDALAFFAQDKANPPGKRFSWTLAGWPLAHCIGPQQDPVRRGKIEAAIRDGSIATHALAYTTYTEGLDMEDLVRSLGFSSVIARKFGKPLPVGAKMTDVPGHSWIMPTLLRHAGVKFLQIGDNYAAKPIRVPPLFWWEGPDGSRILCGYTCDYGSTLAPPRNWPAKNYLAAIVTHDNSGLPKPAAVATIRQLVEKGANGIRYHFGTLDDFASAVTKENPDLPVVRGDMLDTWIHGIMSMPVETAIARDIRPLEPALDALDTQLRLWGVNTPSVAAKLAEAYDQSGLYGEHTWGAWGTKGSTWDSGYPQKNYFGDEWKQIRSTGAFKKFEATFDDHRDYIRRTDAIVRTEIEVRLKALAGTVKAPKGSAIVYNPLPWSRSGVVEIDGKQIFAENIPACGYKVLLAPSQATHALPPAASATIQEPLSTAHFVATFDLERGGIRSLVEKATGREIVDKTSPYVLGQYLHERFTNAHMEKFYKAYVMKSGSLRPGCGKDAYMHRGLPNDITYAAITPARWRLIHTRTPAADIATLTAGDTHGLAQGIATVFTFHRDTATVEAEWRVTGKTPNPIPEGGWFCFPVAAAQPQYLFGRLGGPITPKEILRGGNVNLICLNTGMAVTGSDGGVGLCPIDAPCVSIGQPGLWKSDWDFAPKSPTVFVNLYNNMWATNFPFWIDGSWRCRVRLWAMPKSADTASQLAISSWEARMPLLAVSATGTGGRLPAEQAGLTVSRKGVLVTAFGVNPDGTGTLLRVWEQAGQGRDLTIELPGNFKTATPVSLRGEAIGPPVDIKDGRLTFLLHAYAPASFILK